MKQEIDPKVAQKSEEKSQVQEKLFTVKNIKDKPLKQAYPDVETRIKLREERMKKPNDPQMVLVRFEIANYDRRRSHDLRGPLYFFYFIRRSERMIEVRIHLQKKLGLREGQFLQFFTSGNRNIRNIRTTVDQLANRYLDQDGILYINYSVVPPPGMNFRLPPMRKPIHFIAGSLAIFAAVFSINYFLPLTLSLITVTLAILALAAYKFYALIAQNQYSQPYSNQPKLSITDFLLFALWYVFSGVSPDDYKQKKQPKKSQKKSETTSTKISQNQKVDTDLNQNKITENKQTQNQDKDPASEKQDLQVKKDSQEKEIKRREKDDTERDKSESSIPQNKESLSDAKRDYLKKVFPDIQTRKRLLLSHKKRHQSSISFFIRIEPLNIKEWYTEQDLFYNVACQQNIKIVPLLLKKLKKNLRIPNTDLYIYRNNYELVSLNATAEQLTKDKDGLVYIQYSRQQVSKFMVLRQKLLTREVVQVLISLIALVLAIYIMNMFFSLTVSMLAVTIAIFVYLLSACFRFRNNIRNMPQQEKLSWAIFMVFVFGLIFYKPTKQNKSQSQSKSNHQTPNPIKDQQGSRSESTQNKKGQEEKSKQIQINQHSSMKRQEKAPQESQNIPETDLHQEETVIPQQQISNSEDPQFEAQDISKNSQNVSKDQKSKDQ